MQSRFEKKVEAFIKEQNLIVPGDRVLIGLSGGADSTCLTVVLQSLAERLEVTLGAFHVNHGIRGAEADNDESFSRELCRRFGIPFFAVHENVPDRAKEWQMGPEETGRLVRYRAAERIAEENGYNKIALAHHQNDVAETLLFHLFRGSSIGGLASIPVKRENIIRPLLGCDREEIEAYLEKQGVTFCTDATNNGTEYTRNKIRHRIVACAVKEINAGAVRHMAETAEELSELEEYLAEKTEELCRSAELLSDGIAFSAAFLTEQHRVLQRRIIHRFLGLAAGSRKDITREHVEAVLGLITAGSGKRISLPYGLVAGRDFDRIFIKTESGRTEQDPAWMCRVQVPGVYPLGHTGETIQVRTFPYKKNEKIPKNEYTKWFDYDKIRGALSLRTYHEGDRLGIQKGRKTLKSIWVEHKVPVEQRRKQVLLADEEQVLWIPGLRCCDNYRIDETTRTVLEVQRNGGNEDGREG
ncbi:MAG: tRNA lysidine(34) synthetase TilS [Lachnospiraceae bacterium]|nr:tRNA lysidine(34) synthetase TilS [Lachnospiraceae bacterium]